MPTPLIQPTVLWESAACLLINKPAGLNVEHWPGFPSAEDWAQAYLAQQRKTYVGIVHRLDRAVSGVLLLAKKKSALRHLNEQFRLRQVQKSYRAIVQSPPPAEVGELRHWIRKDQLAKRAEAFHQPTPGAAEARLQYTLLAQLATGFELELVPDAGKFHQIRVQLAAAGCPILGDTRYGATLPFDAPDAIALHATSLSFTEPDSGQLLRIEAPTPWSNAPQG